MIIRKATVEDASAIAQIHVHTWRAAYAGIVPADYLASLSEEKRTVSWREQLGNGQTEILVAMEDGKITGWASAGPSRDPDSRGEAEIYAIYVSPEHWRRKIGRVLMEKVEEALTEVAGVTLWVLRDNQRAIAFYEKMGYRHDGTEKEIQIGTAKLTEIRLRKKWPNKSPEPTPTAVTPRAIE